MNRCIDCNSLMTKDEVICNECGSHIPTTKRDAAGMFASLVTLAFWISLAFMIAAAFMPNGPKLSVCFLITGALSFLMRTMNDRDQSVRKR